MGDTGEELPRDSLLRLPDELIESILLHVPPRTALSLGSTTRRFHPLVNDPLLWKHLCETLFEIWEPNDYDDRLVSGPAAEAPWKQRFVRRVERDRRSKHLFEEALSSQSSRYVKIQQIARQGYEARGMLEGHTRCADDAEDVLARRFFASLTMGLIHRRKSVQIWNKLNQGLPTTLEEQLAAFDLFVVHGSSGDLDYIMRRLDDIASGIREAADGWTEMDVIQRAIHIIQHLRAHAIVGLPSDGHYHSMTNNFLGFNLSGEVPGSLPLQSAAIFCAIARRLDITASPINYPGHIYVVVQLGTPGTTNPDNDVVYVDPFHHHRLVPVDALTSVLEQNAIPPTIRRECLAPASTRSIVLRVCRNIFQSYREWRNNVTPDMTEFVNPAHACYAYLWCMSIVHDNEAPTAIATPDPVMEQPHMMHLLAYFRDHFPEDERLVDEELGSYYRRHGHGDALQEALDELTTRDRAVREQYRREGAAAVSVRYRVGQMLQHKRYRYVGVVRSWTVTCDAPDEWISQMRVDELTRGRTQAFYHVLGADGIQRYVAEDNIEPLSSDPPEELIKLAGRYFRRWDVDAGMFISNVRDEFPDD